MTPEEIKNQLSEEICESMYMDREELEDETLFSDFGLESTTLIKIIQRINERYSCSIQVKELLPYQTLNSASVFIYKKLTQNEECYE
jgi:acyl carrier protein